MMILAVFRSRAHTLDFAERLQSHGIDAAVVSTPKEARIGCGVCVRFALQHFSRVQALLKMGRYSSFKGFYKTEFSGGAPSARPFG